MANGGAEEVVGNREEITDGRSSPIPAILKSSPQDPVHDKDDSLNQLVLTETTDRPRQSTSNSGRTQDKSRKSTVPSTTPVPTTDARKYDIIRSFLEEQSKKGAEAPRPFSRSRETQKTYPPRSKIVEDYTIRQQTRYRTAEEPPGRNRVVPEIAAIVQEYAVTRRTTTDSRRTSESRRRTPSSRTTESPRTTTESILSFERELEKFNNLSPTPDEPRPLEPVRTTPQTSSHRPTTTSAAPSPTTQSAGRQCTTDCADRQSNIRYANLFLAI
ncbi:hypothetical protein AAG570_006137 [Ranatra chinensis]|uniref:Uncharacterized protein n=1 Tax=Ranatra chinensis TaxID=642074 RepID=A0ABD0YA16_9HEMI